MKTALPYLLAACFFIVGTTLAFSQNNSTTQITAAPFSLLDPGTGTFRIGFEQRLSYHLALSVDYGLKFNLLYNNINTEKHYHYYKSSLQIKYFIKRPGSRSNLDKTPFIGIQGLYFPQRYTKENGVLYKNNTYYDYKRSDIKRKAYAVSAIAGFETKQRRLVYNLYGGFGVRLIDIKHHLYDATQSPPYQFRIIIFPPLDRYEGSFYRINFVAGFKIGYIIK